MRFHRSVLRADTIIVGGVTARQVRSVPVYAQMGIAIAARTPKPEAAYTALKGLVHVMQQFVVVPAEREAVARLGELRPDLQPEEVEAIQRSLWSWTGAATERAGLARAMWTMQLVTSCAATTLLLSSTKPVPSYASPSRPEGRHGN